MTALRIENKVLLDFGNQKLSLNKIHQALQSIPANSFDAQGEDALNILHDYDIIVGKYTVRLWSEHTYHPMKRKRWDSFSLMILDSKKYYINLQKEPAFKNQDWSVFEASSFIRGNRKIKSKDICDAILHCSRLSNLRAFL